MLYVNSGSESWRPHSGRGMLLKRHHAIRRRPLGAQTCAHLFQAITILITLRLFANNYIDEAVHRLSPQPSTHHVSPSRYHFISSQPTDTPSKDPIPSLLVKWLTNQDTRFQALFESALQAYEQQTSITLAEHPLALQLQSCDSVESIIALLLDQTRSFSNFRESDRIIKSIKATVSILNPLSVATSFVGTFGLVCQNECADSHLHILDWFCRHSHPRKQYRPVSQSYLLYVPFSTCTCRCPCDVHVNQAANGVVSSWDALVELLESIDHFLNRLDMYTRIPHTLALDEIVIKIMVELLSTLALATRELKQGRSSESVLAGRVTLLSTTVKFVKKVFGEKDVDAVLQRLDRLTQDEARTTAAQILSVVYGLAQNMSVIMDGEQTRLASNPAPNEYVLSRRKSID